MIISLVPTEGLPQVWARVAPMLDKSLDVPATKRMTILDMYDMLLRGKLSLWIGFDPDSKEIVSAAVTQVVVYPAYKALSIPYLGGSKLDEWMADALDVMKRYAKALGCRTLEGYGRDAWIRAIKKGTGEDWKKAYAVIELDLEGETEASVAAE